MHGQEVVAKYANVATRFSKLQTRKDKKMDALLQFVRDEKNHLPKTSRANVSSQPVSSTTFGVVNKRNREGFGISHASSLHNGFLIRLLHGVAQDATISGPRPDFYNAICLNVDFACDLHLDAKNEGMSTVVAAGDFSGGELFVEADEGSVQLETPKGDHIRGNDNDINRRFYALNGADLYHGVRPYEGFRISVVFFSHPEANICPGVVQKLAALGFPMKQSPLLSQLRMFPDADWKALPPYCIFICTTRRHSTVMKNTLGEVLSDGSVSPASIVLCVRDVEDANAYASFASLGLRLIIYTGSDGVSCEQGLPEQRQFCLAQRPLGSWNLFLDDDVKRIHKHECVQWMTLHDLIIFGFMRAEHAHIRLWGLNTSADVRNLRDQVSHKLGLVNGYFFGLIHQRDNPKLSLSNRALGAAEDIERSIRYFHHRGTIRLNFASAAAQTWDNNGGLQNTFGTQVARQAAHDFVVHMLCNEFPNSLMHAPGKPNRCSFLSGLPIPRLKTTDPDGNNTQTNVGAAESVCSKVTCKEKRLQDCEPRPASDSGKLFTCHSCPKTYVRKIDLEHHIRTQHGEGPIIKHECPQCKRSFLRIKDLKTHLNFKRCFSKKGRY